MIGHLPHQAVCSMGTGCLQCVHSVDSDYSRSWETVSARIRKEQEKKELLKSFLTIFFLSWAFRGTQMLHSVLTVT